MQTEAGYTYIKWILPWHLQMSIHSIYARLIHMGQVTKLWCLVTWFCYQLIAKPGNKTATVSWPDPYDTEWWYYFDGLVQERCNSSALAMEIHFSCTKPLIHGGIIKYNVCMHIYICLSNTYDFQYIIYMQLTFLMMLPVMGNDTCHQESLWVWAQPMRDNVGTECPLSLAQSIPIPGHCVAGVIIQNDMLAVPI